MKAFKSSPAFTLCYDFLRWLIPVTQAFPRSQRFGLAHTLNNYAFNLQEHLFAAVHATTPSHDLAQADINLAMLRTTLRLSYDLQLLKDGGYQHGHELLHQLGKVIGAWRRTLAQNPKHLYTNTVSMDTRPS